MTPEEQYALYRQDHRISPERRGTRYVCTHDELPLMRMSSFTGWRHHDATVRALREAIPVAFPRPVQ